MTGRRRGSTLLVAVALTGSLMTGQGPAAAAGRDTALSITVDGRVRTALVHVPPQKPGIRGLPLVLAFHGRLGDGAGMRALTGMDAVADENGFLVVYPDGVERSWNDGRTTTPANAAGVDDVAFVRALLAAVQQDFGVDDDRIFATGMSNGGFLTQRLGCELAGTFAAIAPVASTLPRAQARRCDPDRALPVLMIAGTQDTLVPYDGNADWLSARASAKRWRQWADCPKPQEKAVPDRRNDRTSTSVLVAKKCRGGAAVKLFTVEGGGHTWPGGLQYVPRAAVGRTARDFQASRVIWDFFAAHDR